MDATNDPRVVVWREGRLDLVTYQGLDGFYYTRDRFGVGIVVGRSRARKEGLQASTSEDGTGRVTHKEGTCPFRCIFDTSGKLYGDCRAPWDEKCEMNRRERKSHGNQ